MFLSKPRLLERLTVVVLMFGMLAIAPSPQESKITIIVNPANPLEKLTPGEVKLYWLRKIKKRWPVLNKNILPVDRRNACPERDAFYSRFLNMSADEVESYFSSRQYQNAEKPQDKFQSDAEIIDFVSREPGAIAFVRSGSMTAELQEKVKIVFSEK